MKTLQEPAALVSEVNSLRKKVGLDPITLNEIAANTFHSAATSYAFHFSLSKEMVAMIGSIAMGYPTSISGSSHFMNTSKACTARGLVQHNGGNGLTGSYELTRVGCAVALMLHEGKFIDLSKKQRADLKDRL